VFELRPLPSPVDYCNITVKMRCSIEGDCILKGGSESRNGGE